MRRFACVIAVLLSAVQSWGDPPPASSDEPRLVATVGIRGGVGGIAFSSDGRLALTGAGDDDAVLWDVASRGEVRRFSGHSAPVLFVALFDGDCKVLTGSQDGTARVWDAATGDELLPPMPAHVGHLGHDAAYGSPFAVSPDGRILTADSEGSVHVRDSATGTVVLSLPPRSEEVGHIAVSPDGRSVLVAGWDGTRLHDLASGQEIWRADGDSGPVAFSPDGSLALTTGLREESGFTLILRRPADGAEIRTLGRSNTGIWSAVFSPDASRLASGGYDRILHLWDVATGREVASHSHPNSVGAIAFDPAGRVLLTGDWSGNAVLRNASTGIETGRLSNTSTRLLWLGFLRERPWIVAADTEGAAFLWDPVGRSEPARLERHLGPVLSAAVSRDGTRVLTGGNDWTASLWDTATGLEVQRLEWHEQPVSAVAFSADGRTALTAGGPGSLWDLESGEVKTRFQPKLEGIAFVPADLSQDGRRAVGGLLLSFGVQVFDTGSGAQLWAQEGAVTALRFSPDGRTLAIGDAEGKLLLHDAGSGAVTQERSFAGGGIQALAFSADGTRLAVTVEDGTVWVRDLRTGGETALRNPHGIELVALSRDGRFALAGGLGVVHLWDVVAGRRLCSLALFADGRWIISDSAGRFDTDDLGEAQGIAWQLPSDPFSLLPPEIYMRPLYEPQLLRRILEGETLSPVPPLASLDRVQPIVEIAGVEPVADNPSLIDVAVIVRRAEGAPPAGSGQTGVRDLRVFRDGQLVGQAPARPGSVPLDPATGMFSSTFRVRLPQDGARDAVELSAHAFNDVGVKSRTARATHKLPTSLPQRRGRAYVVTVGIDAFEDPSWNLRFAVADARLLHGVLPDALKATVAFEEVIPVVLLSEQLPAGGRPAPDAGPATKANIRALFDLLAGRPVAAEDLARIPGAERLRSATPDDVVIFSLSTHGVTDAAGGFHLAPSDLGPPREDGAQVDDEALRTWISNDELSDWVRDVDAGSIILIVDACQSAATVHSQGFKPGPLGSRGLGQLAYDKGMRIVAATGVDSVALESGLLRQGFLSFALGVDGLQDGLADWRPRDGAISLSEWFAYGVRRVPEIHELVRNGTAPVALKGGRTVKPFFPGGSPSGSWAQEPVVFDFASQGRDLLLQGKPHRVLALRSARRRAGLDDVARDRSELDALEAAQGADLVAKLYRYIAEHPGSPLLASARAWLVSELIGLSAGSSELVAAGRLAAAHLRDDRDGLLLRRGICERLAEILFERKEELPAALAFAQKALALVPDLPPSRMDRLRLQTLINQIEAEIASREEA